MPVETPREGQQIRAEFRAAVERGPAGGTSPTRLASLDAFRGFIMFWIVGGEALMGGFQKLGQNFITNGIVHQLNHTPWQGLRFYDCIWPSFMLMVGMSIPFSYAKRSQTGTPRQLTAHAAQRAAVLFLLGSLRESILLGVPCLIELSSALQPIAIAYLVAFFLARKSPRYQALVAGLIWVGYALLLAFVPAPEIPAGTYELNHNLVNYVDVAIFGQHWARWPYAPEGWGTLLSTIPIVSTTLVGLLLGELLRSGRPAPFRLKVIAGVGLGAVALGYALSPVVPIIMKLWTTSYGLASAGVACLMFSVFYWAIDIRGWRRWAFPFAVIGMNALAVYFSSSVTRLSEVARVFTRAAEPFLGAGEELVHAILLLSIEWLILWWMYRRKIFLRA
jgi:predicted acyltransferase